MGFELLIPVSRPSSRYDVICVHVCMIKALFRVRVQRINRVTTHPLLFAPGQSLRRLRCDYILTVGLSSLASYISFCPGDIRTEQEILALKD